MFELTAWEILLMVVWVVGLAAALTLFVKQRTFTSALIIGAAAVLPVVGSLIAIGMLVISERKKEVVDDRS